jgi:predicted O-methyltransferase YrrM
VQKVPASKRFIRILKILFLNFLFFFLRLKKFKNLLNHIYQFDPHPLLDNINIIEIDIEDIFQGIGKQEVILKDLELKYGSMSLEEILYISLLVKRFQPKQIFEFGTFIGVTTLQMALNTDVNTKIYTMNLSSQEDITKYSIGTTEEERKLPGLQPGNRLKNSLVAEKIVQLYGDSATYDYTNYTSSMDFILIDASHEYEYVKSDTMNSFNMLKQGGMIIWHDYPNAPGVYDYLNEITNKMKIYHIKNTHLAFLYNFDKNSV